MCLAVPSKIVELAGDGFAIADTLGAKRRISLALLEDPVATGDYVIVHVGYAMQRLDEEEALESIKLFSQMLEQG